MPPPAKFGFWCLGLWLVSTIIFAGEPSIEVVDIENNIFKVTEIKMDEKNNFIMSGPAGKQSLSAQDMLEINFATPLVKKISVWEFTFSNNDLIYGTIKESLKDGIKIESTLLGLINLKMSNLLMIKSPSATFEPPQPGQLEDMVYFLNGDSDKGIILNMYSISLTMNSSTYKQEKSYNLKEIGVITFSQLAPPPKEPAGVNAFIIGLDGTRLSVGIKKFQDETFRLKSPYDQQEYELTVNKINRVYFKNQRCVYLSDLEPITVREYPTIYDPDHIIFPWKYRKDRSVIDNSIISIKGKKYYKGLGVHANSELTYHLKGEYQKFVATVGLDDTAGPRASVQFLVYLDGNKIYESKVIKWGDEPETINLKVKDAKEMKLVLTDGGDLHILDRAVWAGARLIK